jgi:hypothetical protein
VLSSRDPAIVQSGGVGYQFVELVRGSQVADKSSIRRPFFRTGCAELHSSLHQLTGRVLAKDYAESRFAVGPEHRRLTTLYCTRCGTPSARLYVQAITDDDTCANCGSSCWQPADAPPTVKYVLSAEDCEWLRTIRILADSE